MRAFVVIIHFFFCYGLAGDKFAVNLRLAADAGPNVFYC